MIRVISVKTCIHKNPDTFCQLNAFLTKLVLIASLAIISLSHAGEMDKRLPYGQQDECQKAIALSESQEAQDNPAIQYCLGLAHLNGWAGREKSAYVASLWLEKSASQHFIEAQYELGKLCLHDHHNFSRDLEKSRYWMEQAARNGHANAQYETAKRLETRYDRSPDDLLQAVHWYKLAAENGHSEAQNKLATFYETGTGIRADVKKACYWAKKSAAQNHPAGIGLLGRYETEGIGGKADVAHGLELIGKAAGAGDPATQFLLGEYYHTGRFLARNDEQAVIWYQEAAGQNYLPAMKKLADILETGSSGISPDKKAAAVWRKKISRIDGTPYGNRLEIVNKILTPVKDVIMGYWHFPLALFCIAFPLIRAYRKKRRQYHDKLVKGGVNQFRQKQYDMARFFLSNEEPEIENDPDAQAAWGEMLAKGLGVEKNVPASLELLVKASQSNGRAAWLIGSFYEKGENEPKNMENALFWYERGAELDDPNACNRLGIWYATGNVVEKDETKAFGLIYTSADQGHPDARYNLAVLYHNGQGTPKNDSEAFTWLEKSAASGHKPAAIALAHVYGCGLLGKSPDFAKAQYWQDKANSIKTSPSPDNLLRHIPFAWQ